MKLYELAYICRLYSPFARFDASLDKLQRETEGSVHVENRSHRRALFVWLRAWGCRQFGRDNEEIAAGAYADLERRPADRRNRSGHRYQVAFGPTASAKVLFALRPTAFPPWDDAIRKHFGYDGGEDSYRKFLDRVRQELGELVKDAGRLGVKPRDIPRQVGRVNSSLPKLVDEYHWVTVTRKLKPPIPEEFTRWAKWAKRKT